MRDDASGNKEKMEILGTDFVEGLPIGAYQVDNDGNFIYCNKEAAKILGYDSKEELMKENISDLYPDPKLSEKLHHKMVDKGIKHNRIRWKTKKEGEIFVDDYAELVYDETGNYIGVRGIFIDSTLLRLFDDLNAGVYRIGKDKKSVKFASEAVARIFGYDSPEYMINIDITQHYKNPNDYKNFINVLEKEGKVENYHLEMKTKDGRNIAISTNCRLLHEYDRIFGYEGTFTDITEQKKLEKILEQPLGVYEVENRDGKSIITYCNTFFANMFGYESKNDIINKINIDNLYANEEDIEKFKKGLKESDKKGEPFLKFDSLKMIRKNGKEDSNDESFWIEQYIYSIKDENGSIIGRKGIIRDISDSIKLEAILKTRDDIQRFTHGLVAPILSIHSTSEVLLDEIVQEFVEVDSMNMNLENVKSSIQNLLKEIQSINEKLLGDMEQVINACKEESLIDDKDIEELVKTGNFLKIEIIDTPRKIILIRNHQQDVRRILSGIRMIARTGTDIRNRNRITDPIQICLNDLSILDRLYILYTARQNMNKCKMAYHLVEGFRQIMKRFGEKVEREILEFKSENIVRIIDEVIDIYSHDAYVKGLIIHPPTAKSLNIEIARSSIERVLSYIIQNAVKYSFSREGYIKINLADLGDEVRIDVENYGAGILKEEIDEGKIFEYGFRGEYSKDRNRTGSGIGLSESLRIVKAHKGRIEVESIPIGDPRGEISSNTPHKTTVSIFLPKKQKKGGGNG